GGVVDAQRLLEPGAGAQQHAGGKPRGPADLVLGLGDDHRGAGLRRREGGGQPGGPRPDHDDVDVRLAGHAPLGQVMLPSEGQYDRGRPRECWATKLKIISRLTGATRCNRAAPQRVARPYSVARPLPPWVWMASSSACRQASAAENLAMLEASLAFSPWSCSQAAFWAISRASSMLILARASGWDTPWWAPIGTPHTWRSRA